jgi:hypothetical protein
MPDPKQHSLPFAFILSFAFFAFGYSNFVPTALAANWSSSGRSLPLVFEPNQGQLSANVRFRARASAGDAYLTSDGLVIVSGKPGIRSSIRIQLGAGSPGAVHGEEPTRQRCQLLQWTRPFEMGDACASVQRGSL